MSTAIQGDGDTAPADPSQPPVLYGARTGGAGQPCLFCPDAAHIRGVYPTWHWWVAYTKIGGQA